MTANTKRDAFGRLPEELRIKIIELLPDLLSLRNLAHASPAMSRVLDRYALKIVEVVLDLTVPVQTRRLIGAVLKVRFSCFLASLSEAQKVAKTDLTVATNEMRSSGLDRAAAAVRSLLATTENVHAWSHACLEHLIRKSIELRPSTLIKNGAGRTCREEFENAESRKDYLLQDTGPPSWVEEQRMIRSFWQLQFFLELRSAGHKGRLDTNWSRQEVDVLSQSTADGFYDVLNYQREQILTACDFVCTVTSGTITSVEAVYDNAYNLPTIRWVKGVVSRCSCAEPLLFERNKDTFSQGLENLDRTPWAYRFYLAMSSNDTWLNGFPLLLAYPFQAWRKYGFAIWDDKRMVDLGMRHPRKASVLSNSIPYSFRWWSILTEEDMR
ncbi:hypothetical protein PTNB85_02496 [Pyrenophora teres f. teres]|uniref:Uncharacterized protein n=1 Tax=Pyrenophora teres f. teres TaxID=97479 RepID=A0A6S6VTU5_9PLEO|nr:hypothetical protein HRS9139_01077 [Pyrenophora teres f. teres]KAE8848653.1 hypothetical protein PTNB85_02496 [Pyrenophora teres f. teres]KAE8868580.1 hypothetical protein PTNB29_02491 [Pyrenophora teres f. teres]CAE7021428.1 hypothetical protein PTTW11_03259 [Pyrenophora teres f. teres]